MTPEVPGKACVMRSEQAVVEGIPVCWSEEGSGVPVVMVHGIPTSPVLWRHVVPLVEGRRLAWEMVGYGSSIPAGHGRDISVGRQADYLLAWMRALDLAPAVLVGHDLGGGVVQIAAVRRPEACAGLVLTNSICYDSWPIPSVKAMRAAAPLVERLPRPLFRATLAGFIRRGHDDATRAAESSEAHWAPYRQHGPRPFVRQIRSLDPADTLAVASALPSLGVPARLVWGAADPFQKLAYGERLAADLGAPLRPLAGARHFVPEDHPAEVAEAVRAVVEEAAQQ